MTTPPRAKNEFLTRSAGVLLHVSSLPGPYGIGDLGPAAYAWIEALARARQSYWQVLPLGPTSFGDSPYQAASAFAGNPNLISPDLLLRDGLLQAADLAGVNFPAAKVDYGPVIEWKLRLTAAAWGNFLAGAAPQLVGEFEEFCRRQAYWLADFADFMIIKALQGGASWQGWPQELARRQPAALVQAREQAGALRGLQEFRQFLFFRQWQALKDYAHQHHIKIIGDMPLFVALDSADVWANPELFELDERRHPTVVAGVPPDYFSATGQLWGNPHYCWSAHQKTGYAWWIARVRAACATCDVVRLDHFRGFEACWQVPAANQTAAQGRWVAGPGAALFNALAGALGPLPLVAEDLGFIPTEVNALRREFGLPGMRVLQFAFGGGVDNYHLPHNYECHTVVYTGTHDNDTTHGWYRGLSRQERQFFRRYAPGTDGDVAWDLIRLAWASVADVAIAPLQDVLGLGRVARMNLPGKASGHWAWRYSAPMLTAKVLESLADLTAVYGRAPHVVPPATSVAADLPHGGET